MKAQCTPGIRAIGVRNGYGTPDEEAAAAIRDRAADEEGLEFLQGELGREEGTEADELGMDHGVPRERE